jgi:hypothetical protein
MTEGAAAPSRLDWIISAPLLLAAAVCAGFAFVGLDASSYWIDELFSLYVVDHHGGPSEVLRRALTDTHPPAYYFIVHEWIQAFGSSETATRALSAIFGVAALPVLFFGLRGTFSLPARSFAVALAAGSKMFFAETQDVRSYSLCVLIAAGLLALTLAIHRRLSAGERAPPLLMGGLWALGLLGCFTHFYLFLAVGMAHLFLLVTARTMRARAGVLASGLTLLGLTSLYVVSLLRSSRQDLHNMWFNNRIDTLAKEALNGVGMSWTGLAIAALVLLLLAPWADRVRQALGRPPPPPPSAPLAPLWLCILTILGTLAAGLAVSFALAPSFGARNLIALGPFFWALAAWLYDAAGPDPRRRSGQVFIALVVLLTVSNVATVATRRLPRAEDWRGSAAYVDASPGCAGQPIAVVLPFVFGPSTPFFRDLAQTRFFGRYEVTPERLHAYIPGEFAPATADPGLRTLLRDRGASAGCKVLAWGVHDLDPLTVARLQADIAATAGLPPSRVGVRAFADRKPGLLGSSKRKAEAFVFERLDAAAPPPAA